MKVAAWSRWVVGAILVCSLGACVQVSIEPRPNPERRYFALDASGIGAAAQDSSKGILKLAPVRVAHRYDSKGFIYRIGSDSFETDFYNHFLVAPGPMVTDELRQVLSETNLFKAVVDSASPIASTHLLEGTIDDLYGDFSRDDAGKAVLGMSFVMREGGPDGPIIFRKRYEKTIPLQARSPEALVQGWNRALEETLSALVSDLRALK
jgi:cholesterol transport system auxiliary component